MFLKIWSKLFRKIHRKKAGTGPFLVRLLEKLTVNTHEENLLLGKLEVCDLERN